MGTLKWDYSDYTVKGNRTETLDNSHNAIMGRIVILPRKSRDIEEFADHCTAIAKVMMEDMETGEKKAIWKKKSNREDHYRHSFNFMWMAYQRIKYISTMEAPEMEEGGLVPLDEVAGY